MMLLLLRFLSSSTSLKIPTVFEYCSTRMILSALTTLLLTILLGPRVIRLLYRLKTGDSIRVEACPPLAELHQKKKKTPTMGGGLILLSMLISLFLWMDFTNSFTYILLVTTLWFGVLGGIDDYLKMKYKNSKGIKAKTKFGFQLFFGAFLSFYLLYSPLTEFFHQKFNISSPISKETVERKSQSYSTQETYLRYYLPFKKRPLWIFSGAGIVIAFFIILLVVTGSSNAVNLTDGLDGLAVGLVLLVGIVLAVFASLSNHIEMARYLNLIYLEGSGEIGIYLSGLCGACLGFLWYNGYPAEVFMGDIGSLALGGILGTAAVLLRRELLLALIGGLFVAEAFSVILQVMSYRMRNKKRIFRCAPLHHHFEFKGWPEPKVVVRFWMIGFILALIGLASIKFQ